jgi:hypothetical protein
VFLDLFISILYAQVKAETPRWAREQPICSRSLLPRLSFCCISATGEIEIVK